MLTSIIGAIIGKAIGLELLFRWQEKSRRALAASPIPGGTLYGNGHSSSAAETRPAPKLLPPPR